jgi:hypothetical protein
MTDDTQVACALGAGELEQRLAAIAAIGRTSLISRELVEDRDLLRFRASATTRRQLEAIVAAEAACCPFLDLSLSEEAGELLLTIAAPENGRGLAEELARAFAGQR